MIDKNSVSGRTIAELIEQLGRSCYGEAFIAGLNPAQWTALRYFGRANRFSRTVGAFARYHGTTRGTASQTVKSLVLKGYLRRRPVREDLRSVRLELTFKGLGLLAQDPLHSLENAASELSSNIRNKVAAGLQVMLGRLLAEQDRPLFGVCMACMHLQRNEGRRHTGTSYECGVLGEALAEEELVAICVNHEPKAPSSAQGKHRTV